MTLSTLTKTAKHLKAILIVSFFFSAQSMLSAQCTDLYIAGVIDGDLTGGLPKGILFCANANIPDLSIYGFGAANNGGGTDGEEFTFPTAPLNAGDCFWVGSESTAFNTWFGFDPCFTDGDATINGDDAIELFCNDSVIDVFGEVNCDPNASPADPDCILTPSWEYTDGWAFTSNTTPGAFDPAEWTFSGVGALDGESDNASAANPFPIDTQTCPIEGCGVSNVTVTSDGACSGDNVTYQVCADVSGGSGNYDLVNTDNANAILSSLTMQADGNICFDVTISGPTSASTLNVDVVDNADATCIGGTAVAVTVPACPITTCTITNVTVTADGACSGDNATYTVCADVAAGSGNYDLVNTGNGNAVISSLTGQADGNICFNVTATGPTTAGIISVDVLDNADATCISGTPATVNIPTCPIVGADVYISEFSFDPCAAQGNDGDCEYIIISNAGSTPADISGYEIANAITYIFPAGTIIPAGGSLSLGISANCTGFTFDLSGSWTGGLNNLGETIELNDASGTNVFTVSYDGSIADGDCMAVCVDQAGNTTACMSSLESGGMCPDLTAAAPPVVITDSTCPSGNSASGGVIDIPLAACPTGSTLEYSEDGTTWSSTLPTYLQNGPAQTIMTRCICDSDATVISPPSSLMTNPGSCADCGASISTFPANGN